MKTFEQYWAETWKPSNFPEIMDMAVKAIAQSAWDARGVECNKEIDNITRQFD